MSTALNNALDLNVDVLLQALAYACGLDTESGELSPQWARKACRALTQATAYCWRVSVWSELCVSLTRLAVTASALPDDRVLAPGWELLKVYAEDPEAAWSAGQEPEAVGFRMGYGGAVLLPAEVTTPYYYVRLAPPEFDGTPFNATTNYLENQVVYTNPAGAYVQGECWKATAGSLGSAPPAYTPWGYAGGGIVTNSYYRAHGLLWKAIGDGVMDDAETLPLLGSDWQSYFQSSHHIWAPQRLPVFLREAVICGAEAWLAAKEDGQYSAAGVMEKACDRRLEALVCGRWGRQAQNAGGRILQTT